ncbi:hypothetical protein Sfum_2206 [Syntrophobacter fumaroxidans MPOB]|uniref:Uncharacterized protein n=1 Tax=Syntrophobacter fumaroxidans (strain DSM 10017 / MPOB) TaxID=335543 RepID=A0LKD6_SYNFM|nr:hypothetical protein Sfum_2206 [Syntrophobacter fumaroxidans MPOB]
MQPDAFHCMHDPSFNLSPPPRICRFPDGRNRVNGRMRQIFHNTLKSLGKIAVDLRKEMETRTRESATGMPGSGLGVMPLPWFLPSRGSVPRH